MPSCLRGGFHSQLSLEARLTLAGLRCSCAIQNGLTSIKRSPSLGCRFSVDQTCTILTSLGIPDTSRFRDNGVTGGDLLELSAEEMSESLDLSQLQVNHQCFVDAKQQPQASLQNILSHSWSFEGHNLNISEDLHVSNLLSFECDVCSRWPPDLHRVMLSL